MSASGVSGASTAAWHTLTSSSSPTPRAGAYRQATAAEAARQTLSTVTGRLVLSDTQPPSGPATSRIAVPAASTTPSQPGETPSCRSNPGRNGDATPKAANITP